MRLPAVPKPNYRLKRRRKIRCDSEFKATCDFTMKAQDLRQNIANKTPKLWEHINLLAAGWVRDIEGNLERRAGAPTAFPKTFTDPVLGPIELFEWEVMMLDSPLLQRLRGIRQLGMGHAVYNSAVHDRLSHCLGVVEVATRMIQGLEKNAHYRRTYGFAKDPDLFIPAQNERFSIRLAALLHDIGHSAFSHATESLVKERAGAEMDEFFNILRNTFDGVLNIKTSEAMAVLTVLSNPLKNIFEHPRFSIPFNPKDELAQTIAARILGSRSYLAVPYLTGIISGPVDADKLDYMARDSYFTGLPIGLDVNRLISKLEIITITPENVLDEGLRKRAQESTNQRLYQLGISLSGLTAYEQMIVGRVLLYDRVYYHHKVRCGEAMMRRLFELAEEERKRALSIQELFSNITDDAIIYLLSGEMKVGGFEGGADRSKGLATAIRIRHFYHRAYAFAERFIAGLEDLKGIEETDTRSTLWMGVYEEFDQKKLSEEILELSLKLIEKIPDFKKHSQMRSEHILVDLPDDRVTAPGRNLLMRTEGGGLTDANLFFNPEKWSQAYKNQKQCGYVFCPTEYVQVVALASQIVFFQKFGIVMRTEAQHLCKVEHLLSRNWANWMKAVLENCLCTPECFAALTEPHSRLLPIRASEIMIPENWLNMEPEFKRRLAQEFFNSLPGGLIASIHEGVIRALENLCHVLDALEKGGAFVTDNRPDEKHELQQEILKLLRARGGQADEGTEISGGETDIIVPPQLVIENKVADQVTDLSDLKPDAPWQARRYSIALNRRVSFAIIAYKPKDDSQLPPLPQRVSVHSLAESAEACAYVRLLIPWGHGTPSTAKAPRTGKT